jgi:NADPH:quinone reductase-like Zn-dependent oxidoreductase
MRAVVLTKKGGPDMLEVHERESPVPGRGEVLVDVRAVGVNFSDLLIRVGLHPNPPDLPMVLGYEIAGTVAAFGPEVSGVDVGERVAAFVPRGAYAEQAVAAVRDIVSLPADMSFKEGAALPLSAATAYGCLVRYGACQAGERILIHGAAGGVGLAASKLASMLGLEVWGTASARKHDAIRKLGVDHAIDYTRNHWQREVPPLDVVLDSIGGKSFRRSYDLLRPGGRLVCIGASSVLAGERRNLLTAIKMLVTTPRFNPMKQLGDSKAVIGFDSIRLWEEWGDLGALLRPVVERLASGGWAPTVAATFSFDDASAAHRYLTQSTNIGKVVLVP